MSRNPSFAVVVEGGLVQAVLVQDWPAHRPLPWIAIVDYDTEGADGSEITRFPIGSTEAEAICGSGTPTVYESLADALSPRVVLAALGEPVDDDTAETPLAIARSVRQRLLDLDAQLNATEQAPAGDDYNDLYAIANGGLIDILKAMGDAADFGD